MVSPRTLIPEFNTYHRKIRFLTILTQSHENSRDLVTWKAYDWFSRMAIASTIAKQRGISSKDSDGYVSMPSDMAQWRPETYVRSCNTAVLGTDRRSLRASLVVHHCAFAI